MTSTFIKGYASEVKIASLESTAKSSSFDLIFCGDLLLHLKDPITALQRMRSICAGSTIVFNPVKRFRLMPGRPLAEFDGIDEFQWWLLSAASIKRILLATGFDQVAPSLEKLMSATPLMSVP